MEIGREVAVSYTVSKDVGPAACYPAHIPSCATRLNPTQALHKRSPYGESWTQMLALPGKARR